MYFVKMPINPPLLHVSSGRFVSNTPWIHTKRNIDTFVIIVGLHGSLYIQQNDEQYEVKPGNVLILLPNTTHLGYKKSEQSLSYYWCHFHCESPYDIIDKRDSEKKMLLLDHTAYHTNSFDYVLAPIFSLFKSIDRINILFNQLLHISNSGYYTKYGVNYLLTLLMVELTQQTLSEYLAASRDDDNNSKFMEVLEWVRINTAIDISVSDIARRFNYNADYLSRLFKQKTGMSLQKYIHHLKISKAKEMLLHSDNSIKEIAYKVGFHDEKYFMKLFKSYENLTPTQFRNAYFYTHMNNH